MHEADPDALPVPVAMRARAREILTITDDACAAGLWTQNARLCGGAVARLARKRPSPLARGEARIWAAGVIYAVGQVNFLFDRSRSRTSRADQLADAARCRPRRRWPTRRRLINKTLGIGVFEPDLTRDRGARAASARLDR